MLQNRFKDKALTGRGLWRISKTELTRANLKDGILQQFTRSLAKALGVSPEVLFDEVRGGQTPDVGADNKAFRPDPEPWPEPVDGSELLSGIITSRTMQRLERSALRTSTGKDLEVIRSGECPQTERWRT
jgi:hypothetical protein